MGIDVSFEFHKKNIVVVGASSGIGRQVALEISLGGGTVLAIARDKNRLSALSSQNPERIVSHAVDVRELDTLEQAIEEFVKLHGKLHGSVYTAGISGATPLLSYSEALGSDIMDTNFWGYVNLMSLLCRKKYTYNESSHVAVASVAAQTGEAGSFAYSASKAAMVTASRSFAKELYRRNCRVNTVSPGFVKTALTEGYFEEKGFSKELIEKHLLGFGEVEDVSGMIVFLLSDRARWITGADFVIDGGYSVS